MSPWPPVINNARRAARFQLAHEERTLPTDNDLNKARAKLPRHRTMAFVAQALDGREVRYVDGKRYLWLLSLTSPLVPLAGVGLYFLTGGNALMLVLPLIYNFIGVPAV